MTAEPPVPPDPLPTLTTEVRSLDAEAVAGDAVDSDELLALLKDAGFASAAERRGSDRPDGLDRLIVRTVVFGSPDGAETYLGWMRAHAADVLGEATRVRDLELTSSEPVPLFRHTPGDCCPKDTVAYLAAWREGAVVTSLEMAGAAVDPRSVARAATAAYSA